MVSEMMSMGIMREVDILFRIVRGVVIKDRRDESIIGTCTFKKKHD